MVKGYPDFQTFARIIAVDVDSMRKSVNVADILRGYIEAKFYLIDSWRDSELCNLLVDKVVRNVVDFHTLVTAEPSYVKLLDGFYGTIVKRNIRVGGMWSFGVKVGYWVTGGNGQFKVTAELYKSHEGVATVLASSYYESLAFYNTSEVNTNVNLNNVVEDADVYDGDGIGLHLVVEAKNDSGYDTYVRVYMNPAYDECVTLIPLRSILYE